MKYLNNLKTMKIMLFRCAGLGLSCLLSLHSHATESFDARVHLDVKTEEVVYANKIANNGSGPFWDIGNTNIVRLNNDIYLSGLETIPGLLPLNNVKCNLWKRTTSGWTIIKNLEGKTREPCPIAAVTGDVRVYISKNTSLLPDEQKGGGEARPSIVSYLDSETAPKIKELKLWGTEQGKLHFSDVSYRSFVPDLDLRNLILLQNIGYDHAEWTLFDAKFNALRSGQIKWPTKISGGTEVPIRLTYPNIILKKNALYFVGTSDVEEDNLNWKSFKKLNFSTGSDWQFRRLLFGYTKDIQKNPIKDWTEISNVEGTGGDVRTGDMWINTDGSVDIIWSETNLDPRLRDKFYPDAKQTWDLYFAKISGSKILIKKSFLHSEEGKTSFIPKLPKFQILPDGRKFIVYYVQGRGSDGILYFENRLVEVSKSGEFSKEVKIPLKYPLYSFMLATPRTGSTKANFIDMYGITQHEQEIIRFARIQINSESESSSVSASE